MAVLTAGCGYVEILSRPIYMGSIQDMLTQDVPQNLSPRENKCVSKLEFYIKTKPRDKNPFDDTASNSSMQDRDTLCLSLLECLEVEFELLSFEDISITSATLSGARRNAS